jgi:hypothetical protein
MRVFHGSIDWAWAFVRVPVLRSLPAVVTENSVRADGTGFNSRMSRQQGVKSTRFDTKSDTKLGPGADSGGSVLVFQSGGGGRSSFSLPHELSHLVVGFGIGGSANHPPYEWLGPRRSQSTHLTRRPAWRSEFFHLALHRGRKIAKVAMARKLAVHLYWMWRRGWDYGQFERSVRTRERPEIPMECSKSPA